MSVYFLYNPRSGSGFANKIKGSLPWQGLAIDFTCAEANFTQYLQRGDVVVVCGGDGTFSFVAGALHRSGLLGAVSLIPIAAGTGNDFAKSLGVPVEPSSEWVQLVLNRTKEKLIPVWRVGEEYSLLYIGLGLDASILRDVDCWRKKLPPLRWLTRLLYGCAVIKHFLVYKRLEGSVCVDDEEISLQSYCGVLYANAYTYAGGLKLPHTQFYDRKMTVYFFKTPFDMLRLFLFSRGCIRALKIRQLDEGSISLTRGAVQIDGEKAEGKGALRCVGMLRVWV